MIFSRLIYASGTITANGNSGWLSLPFGQSSGAGDGRTAGGVKSAFFRVVPANLATDETLDITLAMAWDSSGTGAVDIHVFTQITATNLAGNVVIPGGESTGILTVATKGVAPFAPWVRFTHALGGTTKSMNYSVYGVVESW